MTTLFKMPRGSRHKTLSQAREARDALAASLERHGAMPGTIERLIRNPHHLASIEKLLGIREDQVNNADRERLTAELAFLAHCRTVARLEREAAAIPASGSCRRNCFNHEIHEKHEKV
jgi:hypothetical protein